jgi:hypothetical protein
MPIGRSVFPRAVFEQGVFRPAFVPTEQSYRTGISVIGEEVAVTMARQVGEAVEVRVAGDPDDAPMSFLWRGRLYVVRAVLGHWRERREWWASAAARAVHGDEGAAVTGAPAAGVPAVLDRERDVWRVEASAGRTFGNGVYDLCREPTEPAPSAQAWRLVQVVD